MSEPCIGLCRVMISAMGNSTVVSPYEAEQAERDYRQAVDEQVKLKVLGYRRAGKTRMTLSYAITEACQGRRVLCETPDPNLGATNMGDVVELIKAIGIEGKVIRYSWVNGHNNIQFCGGGFIHFRSRGRTGRGARYDLVIVDDDSVGDMPQYLFHGAQVIRTVYA